MDIRLKTDRDNYHTPADKKAQLFAIFMALSGILWIVSPSIHQSRSNLDCCLFPLPCRQIKNNEISCGAVFRSLKSTSCCQIFPAVPVFKAISKKMS